MDLLASIIAPRLRGRGSHTESENLSRLKEGGMKGVVEDVNGGGGTGSVGSGGEAQEVPGEMFILEIPGDVMELSERSEFGGGEGKEVSLVRRVLRRDGGGADGGSPLEEGGRG